MKHVMTKVGSLRIVNAGDTMMNFDAIYQRATYSKSSSLYTVIRTHHCVFKPSRYQLQTFLKSNMATLRSPNGQLLNFHAMLFTKFTNLDPDHLRTAFCWILLGSIGQYQHRMSIFTFSFHVWMQMRKTQEIEFEGMHLLAAFYVVMRTIS